MTGSTNFLTLIQTNRKLTRADWDVLDGAISAWARKTTDPASRRFEDLLRDKQRSAYQFFKWVGKRPQQVTPADTHLAVVQVCRGLARRTPHAA